MIESWFRSVNELRRWTRYRPYKEIVLDLLSRLKGQRSVGPRNNQGGTANDSSLFLGAFFYFIRHCGG